MSQKEKRETHPPNRIRDVRLMRGYSLQDVADALALSVSTVHRYECGERGLNTKRLQQMARHLQVGPADLLCAPRKGADPEEDTLLELWRQANSEQRARALQLLAVLLAPVPTMPRPKRQRARAMMAE